MQIVWAIILSFGVLAFAILIKYVLEPTCEEEKPFLWVIGGFFVVYIAAASALTYMNPTKAALTETPRGGDAAVGNAINGALKKVDVMWRSSFGTPYFLRHK